MSRKPVQKKSAAQRKPEPAQIKAIERLLEDGAYEPAVQRIRALLKRFPDHGGLHRALVTGLEHSQGAHAAGLAAFAWAERRPNSLPAQEALLYFATVLQHLMLAERAAGKVRELGGQTRGFPLDPALKEAMLTQPDGTPGDAEAMTRFDIGKLHLQAQDFAGTLHWLEGLDLLPARNNHALALFHLDRIDEALGAFLANWERDPQNLFGLGWAVRMRLYQGDETGARELCKPLAEATARRVEDALAQIDALLLVRQDQSAWDAFERSTGNDWFEVDVGTEGLRLQHFGACAASRLGKGADARRWWQAVLAADPDFDLARTSLRDFSPDGTPPRHPAALDLYQSLPISWTTALRAAEADTIARLDALTASNAYLEALYLGGDATLRTLVGFALKHRAEGSDTQAAALLRAFARLPIGTKNERFGFLGHLRTQGLIGRDEAVEYWDGIELRQVKLRGTEIYREAKETDLPPDLDDLLGEAIALVHDRDLDAAEGLLSTILQRVPDHPMVLGNLAAVRAMQGRPEESRRLLREVVASHPDYLFARCNLAKTLIIEGAIDEAEALLGGLADQERLHIQEVFALYGAQAMLDSAKGNEDAAHSLLASLESMVDDEDDQERYEQAKHAVERLGRVRTFEGALERLLSADPTPGRR